jgi:multicomponent Na+:H+ antiporter subunit B
MRTAVRRVAAVAGLAALGVLLVWAVTGLADFGAGKGAYAAEAVKATTAGRHVTNTVAGVTFDVRGIDTLGEELILFCAAIGSTVLLRAQRAESRAAGEDERAGPSVPAALRLSGALLAGPVVMFGTYVVGHGHLTPGGGFQGGVILAAGLLLVYLACRVLTRPVTPVEVADAVGAAAFVLVAIGGLIFGVAAMANFLPLGTQGSLLSGGTIPVLNVLVGIEVAGALALIVTEFLDQVLRRG